MAVIQKATQSTIFPLHLRRGVNIPKLNMGAVINPYAS